MDHKTPHGLHASCLHRTRPGGLIPYLDHDDIPMATDCDNISIHSTEQMEKYESLCQQEFGHTRVYNVIMLQRVGMNEEPPLMLQTIGWGKLYEGNQTTQAIDGRLCNRANGNASIHQLLGHPPRV
jgi:hypothetical protein